MQINSALVVDDIRENDSGGVDLIGLREELYFDSLPVLLEQITLFIEIALDPPDRGRRLVIELRVLDPDDAVLKAIPIRFTIPSDYARPTAPLNPTLFEVPFERYGLHSIELRMGEVTARRLPLFILPRDKIAAAATA